MSPASPQLASARVGQFMDDPVDLRHLSVSALLLCHDVLVTTVEIRYVMPSAWSFLVQAALAVWTLWCLLLNLSVIFLIL